MALRIGDIAPDFKAETTEGPIRLHDWSVNKWVVFFSHPKDFTPVCTTELGAMSKLKNEFEKRGVKILAISVDHLYFHKKWVDDINETQNTTINFPLIADPDRRISTLYGMIHPNAHEESTVRAVFIIGPDRRIKTIMTYPESIGRNFQEVLRVVDSLQLAANYPVVTPANWNFGEDVIIRNDVPEEELAVHFPKGYTKVISYMKLTPHPVN